MRKTAVALLILFALLAVYTGLSPSAVGAASPAGSTAAAVTPARSPRCCSVW